MALISRSVWGLAAAAALALLPFSGASQAAGQETLIGIVGRDFVLLGADSSVSQGLALTASNLDKIAALVEPFPEGVEEKEDAPPLSQPLQQQAILVAAAGDAAISDRLVGLLRALCTIEEYGAGIGCDVKVVGGGPQPSHHLAPPGITVAGVAHRARAWLSARRPNGSVCLLVAGMEPVRPGSGTAPFAARQVRDQTRRVAVTSSTTQNLPDNRKKSSSGAEESPGTLTPKLFWLDELGSLQNVAYGAHGLGSNFVLGVLDRGYDPDCSVEEAADLLKDCFRQLRERYVVNAPGTPCLKCVDAKGVRFVP